jgi:hypothetical protein
MHGLIWSLCACMLTSWLWTYNHYPRFCQRRMPNLSFVIVVFIYPCSIPKNKEAKFLPYFFFCLSLRYSCIFFPVPVQVQLYSVFNCSFFQFQSESAFRVRIWPKQKCSSPIQVYVVQVQSESVMRARNPAQTKKEKKNRSYSLHPHTVPPPLPLLASV